MPNLAALCAVIFSLLCALRWGRVNSRWLADTEHKALQNCVPDAYALIIGQDLNKYHQICLACHLPALSLIM